MNEYEQAWKDLIKRGFRNNPIFKDVLRELTKELQGGGWRCLEKLLIEKNVFDENKLIEVPVSVSKKNEKGEDIVKESTEKHVSDRERLIRALKNIVIPTKTEKSIREGLRYTPKGDNYREVIEKLREMLPTEEDNNTYSSLDNDGLTYDSDKYSFMLTDANIVDVEDGVLDCETDGTCIILKQNKIDSTDRKYYKVRVKGGLIYDDSNLSPKYELFTVGGVEFKMIHVEDGTFTMGENSYAHQVTLSSYYIGETPVTQALWKAVMGNNPSFFEGDDQRPVERVRWENVCDQKDSCEEFIEELNRQLDEKLKEKGMRFRLPTEAEWEYAARGGNRSGGHQYSGSDNLDKVAWYDRRSGSGTHPVKGKKPNELGIYDMSGNVWEWCQDWHGKSYYYNKSPRTNPTGPESGSSRVIRGGSWYHDAWLCRLSFRINITPDYADNSLGFRLALSE